MYNNHGYMYLLPSVDSVWFRYMAKSIEWRKLWVKRTRAFLSLFLVHNFFNFHFVFILFRFLFLFMSFVFDTLWCWRVARCLRYWTVLAYVHGQAIVTSGSPGWWLSKISWAFEFGYFHLPIQLINAAWLRCGFFNRLRPHRPWQ